MNPENWEQNKNQMIGTVLISAERQINELYQHSYRQMTDGGDRYRVNSANAGHTHTHTPFTQSHPGTI